MTLPRIEELESLDFEWDCRETAWEDSLSELADYGEIHEHCNAPRSYSENTKLAYWIGTQRKQYALHKKGNSSNMTLSRIQALEKLRFRMEATAPPGKTV
jgi:hypothetical protein